MKIEEHISNFRLEMQNLGYAKGEVNAFVHDIVEDRVLSELSQEECNEIKDNLTDYLIFAKKCKVLRN